MGSKKKFKFIEPHTLSMWTKQTPNNITDGSVYKLTKFKLCHAIYGIGIDWVGEAYFDNKEDITDLFDVAAKRNVLHLLCSDSVYDYVKEGLIENEFYELVIELDKWKQRQ